MVGTCRNKGDSYWEYFSDPCVLYPTIWDVDADLVVLISLDPPGAVTGELVALPASGGLGPGNIPSRKA